MSMEVRVTGNRVLISITGELSYATGSALHCILSTIDLKEYVTIIDLTEVKVVDASGIGMLIHSYKFLKSVYDMPLSLVVDPVLYGQIIAKRLDKYFSVHLANDPTPCL